jgi:hypothetical protein
MQGDNVPGNRKAETGAAWTSRKQRIEQFVPYSQKIETTEKTGICASLI